MLSNFEEKLKEINTMMRDLAHTVVEGQRLNYQGFKDGDMEKFTEARAMVKGVGAKANEIDQEIIKTLALFGPEATELREMVGYLKITNELVNTASTIRSYAKNNKSLMAGEFELGDLYTSLMALHASALESLESMEKMVDLAQSGEEIRMRYRTIKVEESKGDDLYSIVQKDISEMLCSVNIDPIDYMTILKMARKLEHISDHAVNVARLILFIKFGGDLESY
jgi:phosphate transport system protein